VGATVYFVDEAGVRSDDHAGTTWAPVGQTPVVAATGDRFGINLLSAVAAKGKLRFAAYEGGLNGSVFSISAAGCWVTALARCSWSWTVIGCTAPRPSRRSPSRPMGGCGCACGPGRRRS